MKTLLGILCGLIALFAGLCALGLIVIVIHVSGGFVELAAVLPLALIPGGIAVLNVLAIEALYGKSPPRHWTLYTLTVIDAAAVLTVLGLWIASGTQNGAFGVFAITIAAAFALKSLLALQFAKNGTLELRT